LSQISNLQFEIPCLPPVWLLELHQKLNAESTLTLDFHADCAVIPRSDTHRPDTRGWHGNSNTDERADSICDRRPVLGADRTDNVVHGLQRFAWCFYTQ